MVWISLVFCSPPAAPRKPTNQRVVSQVAEMSPIPVVLSAARIRQSRNERKSKDPEDVSVTILFQGVLSKLFCSNHLFSMDKKRERSLGSILGGLRLVPGRKLHRTRSHDRVVSTVESIHFFLWYFPPYPAARGWGAQEGRDKHFLSN